MKAADSVDSGTLVLRNAVKLTKMADFFESSTTRPLEPSP